MPNIQTVRAVLFTSLLFPAFCSMAETTSPEDINTDVPNWLAFLETIDFNKSQVVLLELESPLPPPFAALSFKTYSWFKELKGRYPLWTVYYLVRQKRPSELLISLPEINMHSNSVKIEDQLNCHPYIRGLDWKICSIPEGSGKVLSREFQRGAILLDDNFAVTGLGVVSQ